MRRKRQRLSVREKSVGAVDVRSGDAECGGVFPEKREKAGENKKTGKKMLDEGEKAL